MIPGKAVRNRGRGLSGFEPRGFTLMEVLIALSVLAVTMTTVFTLFSAGMKLRSVTRDRLDFDRDARLVVGALMNDFANLVPAGPVPLVSADAVVLWRNREVVSPDGGVRVIPEMVTYQWSGSGLQDSMLVRVAATLAVDIADSAAVHGEFLKWARVIEGQDVATKYFLREGEGSRFGPRAALNELGGAWLGFPSIRAFAFGIAEEVEESLEADGRSRILVRLSPDKSTSSFPWLDPLTSLELTTNDGSEVEAGFWLPLKAKVPLLREGAVFEEAGT